MIGLPCGNPFDKELDEEITPTPQSPSFWSKYNSTFIRVPILITCTVVVVILLIAGTAATAISFPPQPLQLVNSKSDPSTDSINSQHVDKRKVRTALDGDYKLLGPILLTAGCFLLIVNVTLCVIVTRDVYHTSRAVNVNTVSNSMPVWGGPFYLTATNPPPVSNHPNSAPIPFAFSRQLWAIPNAPTPDFSLSCSTSKGTRIRPATASLSRCDQPPFNPDIEVSKTGA